MGWFSDRKRKRDEAVALAKYNAVRSVWSTHKERVDALLELAMHVDEVQEEFAAEAGSVRLKDGERLLLFVEGAGLVEPRTGKGHYEGGSQGVSFRVAKGVTYRVGAFRGTYVRGPDELKMIDDGGRVFVTDQRVLYTSTQQNREWAFVKLVDMYNEDGITFMAVSNRQKTSGFAYGMAVAEAVEDRITLALALFDDELETLMSNLREEQRELRLSEPRQPSTLPS